MNVHGIQAQASDAEEVCALYLRAMDGWNQGCGDAFAAPFAEACDFVAFDGVRFRSREAIARTIRHYSLENSLIYLKQEDTYATVRGPGYVPSYDRYDGPGTGNFHADAMSIVVPQKPAPGKPWVFHPSFLERDSAVAMVLLAKGYYIVLPPISGSGAVQKQWDEVYKRMVDNGFSKKVVMEGTGAKAGESYAWAIANPDKVSVIYARNPLLRSLMSKTPPIGSPAPLDPYLPSPSKTQPIDNLAPLAKAGVPILHDCGSL